MNAPVKIACIQMHSEYQDLEKNLETARRMILEACDNGANLMVLPEIFNVGSAAPNRAAAYRVSEAVPEGTTTQTLLQLAREKKVYICGSIVEREGVDLYNTAIFVGPDGFIGRYRKLHLNGDEFLYYEPGNLGIPVFRTELGRIALLICADAYNPETFRIATMQGADLVCVMFHSSDAHESRKLPEGCYTMAPVLCMAGAVSNHIAVVCCNRVGESNGMVAAGQSLIANYWGAPVSPIGPYDKEAILYAEVDLSDSRRKHFTPTTSRLDNRRTDVYDRMLGYDPKQYPNNMS